MPPHTPARWCPALGLLLLVTVVCSSSSSSSSLRPRRRPSVHLFSDPRTVAGVDGSVTMGADVGTPTTRGWAGGRGIRVVLGPVTKDPANPLLAEGRVPWDLAWWNTYPSVAYDRKAQLYKLWYNGIICCEKGLMCPSTDYRWLLPACDAGRDDDVAGTATAGHNRSSAPPLSGASYRRTATMYAESVDGKNWSQPHLGQVPWPHMNSSRNNNIAFGSGTSDANRGVFLDPHEKNASRRFKAFGRWVCAWCDSLCVYMTVVF